jgi:hypothetical protein
MAEPTPPTPGEPGAPIARDQIDPDLVKLSRTRLRVGVITAAGLVVLCVVLLLRLAPDRRFAGASATPAAVTVEDVLAGKVDTDQLVALTAEPVIGQAIRVTTTPGRLGLRIAPLRGTHDRLWIVVSGDGGEPPALTGRVGRLRKLDELAFSATARRYAAEHPRPVFAQTQAIRAGLATSTVTTVAGDRVALRDTDAVALDVIAADRCMIAASFNERLPDTAAWTAALGRAGLTPTAAAAPDTALGQVRLTVPASVTEVTAKLETAGLWDARVEPVTRHLETTWATMRKSPPAGLDLGGQLLPDAQIELVGLYVARDIPADAYVVVAGEVPDDYWYVMPITVALAAILLVFSWALVRAIRRDLLPARTSYP